jgi:hypothetical protein
MSDQEKQPLLDRCQITIVDGHIEAECLTKDDREELAAAFEEEAILRVKPKVAPQTEE